MPRDWLPNPPEGTAICLGFDGSTSSDWTALKAETFDGQVFTPRYGVAARPSIWDPVAWGGSIPRGEVESAVGEVFARYNVARLYADPFHFQTEIESWALEHGDDVVFEWPTNKIQRMHYALERFRTDLTNGRIAHDGCPLTDSHMRNARAVSTHTKGQYIIGKPHAAQKIDAAMAAILAHEAASDARADGWAAHGHTPAGVSHAMYGFN